MTEAELAGLHQRAAAWLEQQELFEEAARHAVAGRDWERAAGLLEGIGAELYEQDRISALCNWLQGLSTEILSEVKACFLAGLRAEPIGPLCAAHSRSKLQRSLGH